MSIVYVDNVHYAPSKLASILWFLSVLLFLASLYLPAQLFEPSKSVDQGWFFLVFGPCGLLFPTKLGLAGWLANPFYLMALLQARIRISFVFYLYVCLALLAAVFCIPLFNSFPIPVNQVAMPKQDLMSPLAGYWLWLCAILVMLVSGIIRSEHSRRYAIKATARIPQIAHRY